MNIPTRLIGIIGLLSVATVCFADTVTLKDGRIIRGTITVEDATSVSIRHTNASGTITMTDKFEKKDIANITKSDPKDAEAAPASRPPTTRADKSEEDEELKAESIPDKPKFLKRTIEQYEKKMYRLAGISFTKLIRSCANDVELSDLDKTATESINKSLAELAADSHIQDALARARGGPIQFMLVTPYEAEAFVKLLEPIYRDTLTKSAELTPGRPGSPSGTAKQPQKAPNKNDPGKAGGMDAPAPVSLKISDWLENPESFNGKPAEAKAFERHILHTRSMLDAMIRYCPKVKADAADDSGTRKNEELAAERKKIEALRQAVAARFAGALTPEEKKHREEEAKKEAERLETERKEYERMIWLRNQARKNRD